MSEEALFSSYQEALIFAFNYADQQYARGLMERLYVKAGTGKGLVGLDGAGEAGMIMADVMRLSQVEQDVLCVRYTKVKSFCKCCGHEVDTTQVKDALSRLEVYIKTTKYSDDKKENTKIKDVINLINLALIRAVIYEYFGLVNYGNIKKIAERFEVHRDTASRYSTHIKKALRMLERKAERAICASLEAAGKVTIDE